MLEYNATIIDKEVLTDDLFLLKVKPDFEIAEFEPGQFTVLGLQAKESRHQNSPDPKTHDNPEKMIRRSYSILSSPLQRDCLEFYIAQVREGELTPRLLAREVGDPIYVGPKITGRFTLSKIPEEKNLVFVSTGTGIAPFISMLRTYPLANENRHCVLIHGTRKKDDLCFDDELFKLQEKEKNFHYIRCVSREDSPIENTFAGRIPAYFKEGHFAKDVGLEVTPDKLEVLLCGNPHMITDMTGHLESLDFIKQKGKDVGQIHTEEYW